ncbi:hypothetical protein [Burkholderia latens]|uniref:Uncharacterized protein n=1 Tax=Burkholderia latens TaxID=488446 RepID=A0A6P2I930_9BURK|nr:hypothetical protein [Burkholderia latens]VWB25931.1 hypothetical protein BLA24064_01063 [Burkholderia latens]
MGMKAGRGTDRRGWLGLAPATAAAGLGGLAFAPAALRAAPVAGREPAAAASEAP